MTAPTTRTTHTSASAGASSSSLGRRLARRRRRTLLIALLVPRQLHPKLPVVLRRYLSQDLLKGLVPPLLAVPLQRAEGALLARKQLVLENKDRRISPGRAGQELPRNGPAGLVVIVRRERAPVRVRKESHAVVAAVPSMTRLQAYEDAHQRGLHDVVLPGELLEEVLFGVVFFGGAPACEKVVPTGAALQTCHQLAGRIADDPTPGGKCEVHTVQPFLVLQTWIDCVPVQVGVLGPVYQGEARDGSKNEFSRVGHIASGRSCLGAVLGERIMARGVLNEELWQMKEFL